MNVVDGEACHTGSFENRICFQRRVYKTLNYVFIRKSECATVARAGHDKTLKSIIIITRSLMLLSVVMSSALPGQLRSATVTRGL